MLGRVLTYSALLGAVHALPESFILKTGNIDSAVPSSPPLHSTANSTLAMATVSNANLTISSPLPSSLRTQANATLITALTTALTNISNPFHLPTTTIIVTIPNPTPSPTATRSHDGDDRDHAAKSPSDSAASDPLSKWPYWFTAATVTLVIYDFVTLGIFLWLWVFGYLRWIRRGGVPDNRRWWRRWCARNGSGEMARLASVRAEDRSGRYEGDGEWMMGEWVRRGRARSESWERARRARETEMESEMRRLGML